MRQGHTNFRLYRIADRISCRGNCVACAFDDSDHTCVLFIFSIYFTIDFLGRALLTGLCESKHANCGTAPKVVNSV